MSNIVSVHLFGVALQGKTFVFPTFCLVFFLFCIDSGAPDFLISAYYSIMRMEKQEGKESVDDFFRGGKRNRAF